MKIKVLSIIFATIFSTSIFADSEGKRKDIKTVEDVKEYRAQVIDKMTERLDSGEVGGSSPPRPTIHFFLLY